MRIGGINEDHVQCRVARILFCIRCQHLHVVFVQFIRVDDNRNALNDLIADVGKPVDMTDAEIRADALGGRDEAFVTITAMEEAVKADARYERGFKVEGLDAGKYKLAVIKPGKYTVSVVEAEIDGTDDIGTISMRLYGDINNDGKVRAGDATQICRYIAGNRSLANEELLAADVNLDGKVRAGDATQICRYIASNNSAFDTLK